MNVIIGFMVVYMACYIYLALFCTDVLQKFHVNNPPNEYIEHRWYFREVIFEIFPIVNAIVHKTFRTIRIHPKKYTHKFMTFMPQKGYLLDN